LIASWALYEQQILWSPSYATANIAAGCDRESCASHFHTNKLSHGSTLISATPEYQSVTEHPPLLITPRIFDDF
jgi:hypothetical protein